MSFPEFLERQPESGDPAVAPPVPNQLSDRADVEKPEPLRFGEEAAGVQVRSRRRHLQDRQRHAADRNTLAPSMILGTQANRAVDPDLASKMSRGICEDLDRQP